jgi:hypothetical protein
MSRIEANVILSLSKDEPGRSNCHPEPVEGIVILSLSKD